MPNNVTLPGAGAVVEAVEVAGAMRQVVHVANFPATQSVQVANLPATQPVSAAALPLPAGAATESTVSALLVAAGAIKDAAEALASRTLNTSQVAGTVALDTATLAALENVSSTVSGTVSVSNFPALQAVTGSLSVGAESGAPLPAYSAPKRSGSRALEVDDEGALIVRAETLTDEGSFRANFANTSLFVGIGSVTVAGAVVTGSGFATADVHRGDYFKIAADADTACVQIDSIDSDTQITLKAVYVGSSSGTGQRALLMPYTGSGGSQAVASGALTLNSGTTNSAVTGVKRFIDYGPMVSRHRVTVSQRIANQEVRVGLSEDAATPRWFARFKIDGTTSTTVICETGRNPTGAPSASETQSSTVTLPSGATTAAAREYRVEVLTEAARFYVDGVLVAEHTSVMPAQYDTFASLVEVRNGTGAASTTAVTVDYAAAKNHNKLEIGVLSDTEKIVASQPPSTSFTYNATGAIAINTDLLVIDCSQIRSLCIQCVSMGTSGVATLFASNDGVNWQSWPVVSPTGALSTTITSATLNTTMVVARYFRIRLTTAATAGTTNFVVSAIQATSSGAVAYVGGTVTANIGTGALSAGANAIGDVGLQARANATGAASVAKVSSGASTNATSVKASAGRVLGFSFTNTTASVKVVRFYNLATAPTVGTSVPTWNVVIPANGYVSESFPFGRAHSTGIAYAITNAVADLDTTAVAANDVIGAIDFA